MTGQFCPSWDTLQGALVTPLQCTIHSCYSRRHADGRDGVADSGQGVAGGGSRVRECAGGAGAWSEFTDHADVDTGIGPTCCWGDVGVEGGAGLSCIVVSHSHPSVGTKLVGHRLGTGPSTRHWACGVLDTHEGSLQTATSPSGNGIGDQEGQTRRRSTCTYSEWPPAAVLIMVSL